MITSLRNMDWNLLGFGLCRAWITMCLSFAVPFGGTDALSVTFILQFLPAGIIAILIGALASSRSELSLRTRSIMSVASLVFALAGVACTIAGICLSAHHLTAIGIVSSGVSAVLLQILWGEIYAAKPPSVATFHAICAFILSAALAVLTKLAISQSAVLVIFSLFPAGSFFLLLKEHNLRASLEHQKPDQEQLEQNARDESVEFDRFCLSVFAFALIYNFASASFLAHWSDTYSLRSIANLLTGVALFLAILHRGKLKNVGLYRLSFLVFLCALLMYILSPEKYLELAAVGAAVGYKLFDVLAWCIMIEISQRRPSRIWKVFGGGLAAVYLGMALGRGLAMAIPYAPFVPGLETDIIPSALMLLLAVVYVLILPDSLLHSFTPKGMRSIQVSRDALAESCMHLSAQGGLTPRESEVLLLLARGRTQEVIAQRLSISKGTAHTHIIHVYSKLQVHSQQELIDLVEANQHA